jgi:hypothetical protein
MIYVRLLGGLGNQMFQYALGRRLALINRTELVGDTSYFEFVPKRDNHFVKREYALDVFNVELRMLDVHEASRLPVYRPTRMARAVCRASQAIWPHRQKEYSIIYEKHYFDFEAEVLHSRGDVYLAGHWQNPKYFGGIEDQIRRDFTIPGTGSECQRELAGEIAGTESLCMNIRRGDFVKNPTHGFVGVEYIERALGLVRQRAEVKKVYVFSDEIPWCEANIRLDCPCYFVPHALAGPKFSWYLHLMTKCRHFVIPNSTFGWWAAWLANRADKIVIAPKQWINIPGVNSSGIIPADWLTM